MALSGIHLANEPGLGSSRTYQPSEMPMPSKPKPALTRMHQEMNSEAASSGSPLRAAVPRKRAKVKQKVQTNQTMQDLDGIKDELERTKRELGEVTKTVLIAEGADNGRGECDTCKEYSSWAVPDGALDASRNESDNGDTAPDSNRSSDNPGH